MLTDKWNNIPGDLDTKILKGETIIIKGVESKHEYWTWDGVYAESLIFLKEDVIDLSREEVIDLSSIFWKSETSEITFSDNGMYVLVNFNFEIE